MMYLRPWCTWRCQVQCKRKPGKTWVVTARGRVCFHWQQNTLSAMWVVMMIYKQYIDITCCNCRGRWISSLSLLWHNQGPVVSTGQWRRPVTSGPRISNCKCPPNFSPKFSFTSDINVVKIGSSLTRFRRQDTYRQQRLVSRRPSRRGLDLIGTWVTIVVKTSSPVSVQHIKWRSIAVAGSALVCPSNHDTVVIK